MVNFIKSVLKEIRYQAEEAGKAAGYALRR